MSKRPSLAETMRQAVTAPGPAAPVLEPVKPARGIQPGIRILCRNPSGEKKSNGNPRSLRS